MCDDYLINFHKNDIIDILLDEDTTKHFSININFIALYEHRSTIAVKLLTEPEKCLEELNSATLKAQLALLKGAGDNAQLKSNVHCRIYHLPAVPDMWRTTFPGNHEAGRFVQVSGTVMRMSAAKLLEYQRNYICPKCKYSMLVKAEYDKKYIIKQPTKCENPDDCSGTNLVAFGELDSDNCKDYQEIKIQEQVKKLGLGCMPNTMWVMLEDDLVDTCKPGDNVTICGIVTRRWGEFSKGCKIDIDIVLKANHIQVDNNSSSSATATPEVRQMFSAFWEKYSGNPLAGRDVILQSFCPQIYGLYLVKLAIAVVLAGGSHVEDTTYTGVRTRSESHLLLVGDPGTGKSQLLRFAAKIIPRSVLTTGVGSTAAGLTVTAMMEHGEWQLEGGALVMSDGGICCIDEFNSMKEHDRTSIHEAMEQQTISVAKASIVCKLNTRCSILAACNPKGSLDVAQPLCMSTALPSPLLSRFDLILILRDTVNEEWDSLVTDYILKGGNKCSKLNDAVMWNIDILQSYFSIIRKLNPKLSENAETILSSYYQMQRRIDSRNKARTTVRLLESLVRLSQGHAKLMYHEEVETVDSIYAIVLVDAAMENDSSILDLNINTFSIFPGAPLRDYRNILEAILGKLGLHRILESEIEALDKVWDQELTENVKSRFFTKKNEGECPDNLKVNIEVNIRSDIISSCENVERTDMLEKHEPDRITGRANTSVTKGDKRRKCDESADKVIKKAKTVSENSDRDVENNLISAAPAAVTEIDKNVSEITADVCNNEKTKPLNSKGNNDEIKKAKNIFSTSNDDLDLDFDEGYDTFSLGVSDTSRDNVKKMGKEKNISSDRSKVSGSSCMPQSKVDRNSLEGTSSHSVLSKSFVNNPSSISDQTKEDDPISLSNNKNNATKGVISENINSNVKENSIKSKLKRFKFMPKDNPTDNNIDVKSNSDNLNVDADKDRKINETVKEQRNPYNDFIAEDLQLLKMMRSDDDLNVDLDFDWDNMKDAVINSKTKGKKKIVKNVSDSTTSTSTSRSNSTSTSTSSSQSSRSTIFRTSDEDIGNLDLDVPKPSKRKIVKTISKASTSTSRSSSTGTGTSSSQSSRSTIFRTADEDIDNLDLDI